MALLAEINSSRLRIVPFQAHHLTQKYVGWLNDPQVVRYSEQRHRTHDLASCRAYFESMSTSDSFFCAIEDTRNGWGHIGNISIAVDLPNKLADISILIGDPAAWNTGIGFEAWQAVLQALMDRDGFRKVTGGTVSANLAMVRIMEKVGMLPDGRRKDHYMIEGSLDVVVYYAAYAEK